VFDALKTRVFPEILKHKSAQDPIRAWVAGCSTGEEVYSLAIALREFLDETGAKCPMQIFGTDLSEKAVHKARTGIYPESAVTAFGAERLQRFFTRSKAVTASGRRSATSACSCGTIWRAIRRSPSWTSSAAGMC
jgi:two-component system CheB/CheR fusion protein